VWYFSGPPSNGILQVHVPAAAWPLHPSVQVSLHAEVASRNIAVDLQIDDLRWVGEPGNRVADAIQQLSLGTNVKIQLQFQRRLWQADGFTGTSYADTGVASGYECAHDDAVRPGILIHGPAGTQGQELAARYALHTAAGAAPGRMVADILAAWEPLFPGVTAAYNGRAWYTNGNLHPFLGGAWSYYSVGQYTGLSGVEGLQEGNIHFAGEHTAPHFQGFMEGAVRSGERVAMEIARSQLGRRKARYLAARFLTRRVAGRDCSRPAP